MDEKLAMKNRMINFKAISVKNVLFLIVFACSSFLAEANHDSCKSYYILLNKKEGDHVSLHICDDSTYEMVVYRSTHNLGLVNDKISSGKTRIVEKTLFLIDTLQNITLIYKSKNNSLKPIKLSHA